METINGYRVEGEWKNSSNAKYTVADKWGRPYFLKEFLMPVYPNREGMNEKTYRKELARCSDFEQRQSRLIEQMSQVAAHGGNLVIVEEFFRFGSKYYKATPFVDERCFSVEAIAKLEMEEKRQILKTLSHSLRSLHRARIIHGDLKPDNILVLRDPAGRLKCRVIDFDDSYFEKDPPPVSEMIGDIRYYSPELARYIMTDGETDSKERVMTSSDVFTLGLIYHEYLTGHFPDLPDDYRYVFEAVLDEQPLGLGDRIEEGLRELIGAMLAADPLDRPAMAQVFQRLTMSPIADKPHKGSKRIQHVEHLKNDQCKVYFYDGSYLIMPRFMVGDY